MMKRIFSLLLSTLFLLAAPNANAQLKLSQIASGGAYAPSTDVCIGVRSGTTDYQLSLGSTFLQDANNLSDVASASSARANLGLVIGTNVQAPITLTTTGTSGAATLISNTLNIPQYSGGGSSAFSSLTSGTNTTAAMVVGSGGSLATTGSGTIAATTVATNANLSGVVTSSGNTTSFGSFSSATLGTALTDETGTGVVVYSTSPSLTTPALGTPSALVGTNISGTAASLTAGHVTTNANLTGPITSSGNATSVASQTGTGSTFVMSAGSPVIGTTSSSNSLTIDTNTNGGLDVASTNTSGAAFTLDSTGGGGHAFQFFATGSANTAGFFGVYDVSGGVTPFAVSDAFSEVLSSMTVGWSQSSMYATVSLDTGMSRDSADVIDFGNGTQGNTTALIKAAGVQSAGTKFSTTTGTSCGTVGTLTGGATAGTYVSGATTCTVVLVMGGLTATNGWSCRATDLTTSADAFLQKQTASTTTTATLTGTTVSSDVISFSCVGY